MKCLVDTNVLLRWSDKGSPEHALCARVIDHLRQSTEIWTCAQVLIEYYVVATRPREVNGLALDIPAAQSGLLDIIEALPCLPEPHDISDRWRMTAFTYNVRGKQAHDARIVAVMLAHNITHLVTLNPRDFSRYPEITPVTPSEAVLLGSSSAT